MGTTHECIEHSELVRHERAVKPGDLILYIQKDKPAGAKEWQFRLIESEITSIRIGKTSTKAYSKRFNPLDLEEIEDNARILLSSPRLILVQEPFLDVENLRERAERWVENRGWENQEMFDE